jgi:hypothetical protein
VGGAGCLPLGIVVEKIAPLFEDDIITGGAIGAACWGAAPVCLAVFDRSTIAALMVTGMILPACGFAGGLTAGFSVVASAKRLNSSLLTTILDLDDPISASFERLSGCAGTARPPPSPPKT